MALGVMQRKFRFSGLVPCCCGSRKTVLDCRIGKFSLDVSLLESTEFLSLDCVAEIIIESSVTCSRCSLARFCDSVSDSRISACPRFSVDHDVRINLAKLVINFRHSLVFMAAHQIKAESVYVVIEHPVFERLDDISFYDRMIRGNLVSAAGSVHVVSVGHAVKIFGDSQIIKRSLTCAARMIVDDIHVDRDSSVMKF